ncbi:MAG: hypothetical protein Q8L97_01435 [Nitrosomonas sp.]|uniref:hypothetical protein n=1 Tax=Nitrosomonas sp. TaxID=42353 RepID=UPI00272F358E|nr:hypothetical protein [Nitrosomonas sp.]MDP1548811.1 hypothetical protein [Nitrosomonas sp.]
MQMEHAIELIKIAIWPTVLIISFLIFRRPISSFIQNAQRFKFGDFTVNTTEAISDKVTKNVNNHVDEIIKVLQYGAYFSRSQAFERANMFVNDYLNNRPGGEVRLEIKITAVSMHYSWPAFVSNISDWLAEHTNCNINIAILLVDPTYINKLPFDKSPINWADESERRIKDMEELVKVLPESQKVRLNCSIRFFEGLPQYHGILINDDELFLGRTDWEYRPDQLPQLTVGQNRYRYFNRSTTEGEDRGSERVDLFLHWHKFYYEYSSQVVFNFP